MMFRKRDFDRERYDEIIDVCKAVEKEARALKRRKRKDEIERLQEMNRKLGRAYGITADMLRARDVKK